MPMNMSYCRFENTLAALRECDAALRRLERAGHAIAMAAKASDATPDTVADEARKLLAGAMPLDARAVTSAKLAVVESFRQLQARFEAAETIAGLETGISVLDDATNGLQPGRLYVLAARPSMGKSLVAGWIAAACGMAGKRAAIFSAEMAASEWTDRWVSAVGKVDASRITAPKLMEDGDWSRVTAAMQEIQKLAVMIDDSPSQSVSTITARAMQMHAAAPLSLIVVDHLGLLDLAIRKGETRAAALGDATKAFKALAKRLGIPVLLLCQLNRESDGREPTMANLRDSGRIEEDADGVFLLHRPGYYDATRDQGYTKLIVGKLRGGKRETLDIYLDLPRMRVERCEPHHLHHEAPAPKRGFGSRGFRKAGGESEARRNALMPDEDAAIKLFFDAWLRLKDFGWREAMYCPKDGRMFEVIEAGSTGKHRCEYNGEWPTGSYWIHADGDLSPSRPVLYRDLPPNA